MKRFFLILFAASALLVACGTPSAEDQVATLEKKIRTEEGKLRKGRGKINAMHLELAELGGDTLVAKDTVYITTTAVERGDFEEFVDIPAIVSSRDNLMLSSEMGGRVTRMLVKEGNRVSRGQLLAEVDAELVRNQIDELNNALSLATTVFEKRERLWNQNIGTEIEYLQAQNQVESLKKSLATANTQLGKAALYAPISGTVDQVFVHQGEIAGPGAPVMRVVNLSRVQITADVSEAYVGKVDMGDVVTVAFPSMGLETTAKVTAVSQVINPNNRSFGLEVEYDNRDGKLKPNQVGLIRLRSSFETDRVIVPSRLVQSAYNGDFVYVMDPDQGLALRRSVDLGHSFSGSTVILDGLKGDEILVDGGFRNVSDSTLEVIKSL